MIKVGAIMHVKLRVVDKTSLDLTLLKNELESVLFNFERVFRNLDSIVVGHFKEFEERDINALLYKDKIFISNKQDNVQDATDDIVHEFAHFLEKKYYDFIYEDKKIKKEYVRIRKIFNKRFPNEFEITYKFDKNFDDFLYIQLGYDQIYEQMKFFVKSPYALTSLREFFASCFEVHVLGDINQRSIREHSPNTFKKILSIEKILSTNH